MLYASPLPTVIQIDPIDYRAEAETLSQVFLESGRDVRLKIGAASATSLTKVLSMARSRKGLVLHLSAHCIRHEEKGLGLVLEDPSGGPHILWRDRLEDLLSACGGLCNISLLVLSACYSEELAQVFVECGCRHVVATREKVHDSAARRFSQQFYYELAMDAPLLKAWESATQALRIDPDEALAKEADYFTLYGQRGAEEATLRRLCGAESEGQPQGSVSNAGLPMRDFADVAVFLEMQLPSRPEGFVGRTQLLLALARTFHGTKGRRAVALHGPQGIGKSALGVEFAHFVAAPGRLFSCAPLLLHVTERNLDGLIATMAEQLEALAAQLGVLLRPFALGQTATTRSSSASSLSDLSATPSPSPGVGLAEGEDELTLHAVARTRIRQQLQQIERSHRLYRILVVIDDEAGFIRDSADARWWLGDLIRHTHHLHLLILSLEPVYETLGGTKVVNEAVVGLSEMESSRLFLQHIHRRLEPRDLDTPELQPGGSSPSDSTYRGNGGGGNAATNTGRSGSTPMYERTCRQLCGHPLMCRLGGNPGHISAASARVTPGGPSLHQLAASAELLDLMEPRRREPAARPTLQRQHSVPACGRREPVPQSVPLRPFSASAGRHDWAEDIR